MTASVKPALPKTALLNTNVLLLWLVGLTDASLFATYKRVNAFRVEDFTLLGRVLRPFRDIWTTPHILAEVSNFLDQAPLYRRPQLLRSMQRFVDNHREMHQAAKSLLLRPEFLQLGLTDTGISALSADAMVITTDFHVWGRILSQGGHCINFNHLRSTQLVPRP